MRSHRTAFPWILALGLLFMPSGAQAAGDGLSGFVRSEGASPIVAAHVYAYDLVQRDLQQVVTDIGGRFRFGPLPAGLYHVIAYKAGFMPAVVPLTRPDAERVQVVDLHLARAEGEGRGGEDYWEVRSRIPADVLRQIETLERLAYAVPGTHLELAGLSRFSTGVEMGVGVDEIAFADAQMAGGKVDFAGRLSHFDIGVQGDFWRVNPGSAAADQGAVRGSTSLVSFNLKSEHDARVSLSTASNRLVTSQAGVERPVDFEHLRVRYIQPLGDSAQSEVAAQVIDERGFYRQGPIDPLAIPAASTTWQVAGSYSQEIGEKVALKTGFTYRDRRSELAPGSALLDQGLERVDLFGKAGHRVRPAMLLEYGLVSVLEDGNLALSPQGGVVLQLSPAWQAIGRASARVTDEVRDPLRQGDFFPMLHGDAEGCEQADELCYQVQLFRKRDDNTLSVGALHREIGETLRLYFSEDFFDQQESLYLVPGDRVPEMQVAISRRLSPNVLARLRSSMAAGGGGIFYAAGREPYQNEVRYLITSLDTRFQATSTGVFVAFHQLEQELVPLAEDRDSIVPLHSKRLQLRVTQDLDALLDLPADWMVHLNMELSRGQQAAADRPSDDLRHRILGGFAVRF